MAFTSRPFVMRGSAGQHKCWHRSCCSLNCSSEPKFCQQFAPSQGNAPGARAGFAVVSAEGLDSTFRKTLRDSHLHQFRFGTAHGTLPTKDVAFTGSWSWREGEMDCCFACTGRATLRSMSMASPAQRLSSAAGRLIQHWQWPLRLTLHHGSRRGRFHFVHGRWGQTQIQI